MADKLLSALTVITTGDLTGAHQFVMVDPTGPADELLSVADFIAGIVGTTSGTVCAGDDARLSGSMAIGGTVSGASSYALLFTDSSNTLQQSAGITVNATQGEIDLTDGSLTSIAIGASPTLCSFTDSTSNVYLCTSGGHAVEALSGSTEVWLADGTYSLNARSGPINSKDGYYVNGNPPAADGTYTYATISLSKGLITYAASGSPSGVSIGDLIGGSPPSGAVLFATSGGTLGGDASCTYGGSGNSFAVTGSSSSLSVNAGSYAAVATYGSLQASLAGMAVGASFTDGSRSVQLATGTYAVDASYGPINSAGGYYSGGTAPAADGTYSSPTSITIKGGIITAIS